MRDCNIIQAARHCGLKLSPIKLPQCLYYRTVITATQPTNGFVDLRKPTSNSGNNLLITDFQVLKPNLTINYKVVQSGMEANKSAIVTIENQF
jgi:hypothetical protein